MDTIFMNSENSKPSDLQKLLLNLSEKMNLKKSYKYVTMREKYKNVIEK